MVRCEAFFRAVHLLFMPIKFETFIRNKCLELTAKYFALQYLCPTTLATRNKLLYLIAGNADYIAARMNPQNFEMQCVITWRRFSQLISISDSSFADVVLFQKFQSFVKVVTQCFKADDYPFLYYVSYTML